MTAVTLHCTDTAQNMHRYYRLDAQPDLFGQWCCIREWGRTGQAGQIHIIPYHAPESAIAAFDKLRREKERRRYV